MRVFTIISVFPVDVHYHELPRVKVLTHVVSGGASLQAAYEEIAGWETVTGATEVFGVENAELSIDPRVQFVREEQLAQWEHWSRMVRKGQTETNWCLLHAGPEPFRDRIDRLFIERNPHLG